MRCCRWRRITSFVLVGGLLLSVAACDHMPKMSNPFAKQATLADVQDEKIAVVAPEPGRATLDDIQAAKERADRQYAASTRPGAAGAGGDGGDGGAGGGAPAGASAGAVASSTGRAPA